MDTKNLSIAEYFDVIQREYLLAEFRRKIYHSTRDKQYYQKVMSYKAEKIKNIAERNTLDSILNNKDTYNKMHKSMFNEHGLPLIGLSGDDYKNYYLLNAEFSFEGKVWLLSKELDDQLFELSLKENKEIKSIQRSSDIFRIL